MKKKIFLPVLALLFAVSMSISDTAFAEDADVFIVQNGKTIEPECRKGNAINKTRVTGMTMMGGPLKSRFAVFIPKNTSAIRTKNPDIFTRHDPSGIRLVKLDTDTYKDKPVRYFMQGAGTGVFEEFDVAFRYKKTSKDLYKIIPEEPLSPGEYGILVYGIAMTGGSMDINVCDFGVDK